MAELKPRCSHITAHNKEERQEGKDTDSGAGVHMIEVGGKGGKKGHQGQTEEAGRRTALIEWEGVGGKERILGRRQVRFPCPAGPWGVVAADVTSGAPPLSLHLCNFPSLWSGVQPVTSWLVCLGGGTLRSITPLSSPCKNKQWHQ